MGQGCILKTFTRVGAGIAIAFCFFLAGCGGVGIAAAGIPSISQIVPQALTAGSGDTTVEVVGSHVNEATVVLWNGTALSTTLVNDTTVSSPVESASIANPGTVELQLMNSVTGSKSDSVALSITGSGKTSSLSITTTSLPGGIVGTPYSASLVAIGGTTPYTWQLTSGTMPAGISLQGSSISGTPTTAGTYSIGLTVTDKSKPAQSKFIALTIIISSKPVTVTPLSISTTSLAAAISGTTYSQTLQAIGGSGTYSWSIASGRLPAGLSLSAAGVISGTPDATGTVSFVAGVKDSGNPAQTASVSLSITVAGPSLNISSTTFAQGIFGRPYNATLQATGGTPGYSWSIASGSLPTGLSLNTTTGVISGTPTGGTTSFVAAVHDSSTPAQKASAQMTLSVSAAPLAITASVLPSVNVGAAYSQTLQATGGTAPYQWSITSGHLPAGLALARTTGTITGTPSTAGTAIFTATATDSSNPVQTASLVMSVLVNPAQSTLASVTPLSIFVPASASGTVGSIYTQTLGASGGTSPYTWSIKSGSLPAGLTLSSTGVISGTPASGSNGSYSATFSVADAETTAQTASATMSIAIAAAPVTTTPLSILSSALASGTTGTAYSQTLQASGGTASYSWSITSGSLPAGLTLSSGGAISGTPTGSGTSTFTATVTDSSSPVQMQSASLSIAISAAQASSGNTWFVRADGGTRYSANVTNGQCNGKTDAAYPGSGVNQNCAFNDVRYLWDDGSIGNWGWIISGGDTVVIRGCHASASQQNAVNPDCRLGWDNNQGNSATNPWGWYAPSPYGSNLGVWNPTIPAGTSGAHTRILGGCAYDGDCIPVTTYPYSGNLTQLFSGFALQIALDLSNTQYVDVAGLELTTHNGVCNQYGSPSFNHGCSNSIPGADDYGNNGILTNNATANVTLTDMNIHGFTAAGLYGPIGGQITMTRVQINFNGFAGWNFADTSNTPDAAGSSIIGSYVRMEGNGCVEEYPIVDTIPMKACYDDNSGGFGDSWSGQDTDLDTFICDHCTVIYNTKDGDIGPHTKIRVYTKTNSFSGFNMGEQWKWGSDASIPQTVTFENNLTVSGCDRMSQPLPGAPSGYNAHLSDFCRAAGDVMSPNISPGSVWTMANNSFVFNAPTLLDVQCYPVGASQASSCSSTINWYNNVVLGYPNIPTVYGNNAPAVFYDQAPGSIVINTSHGVEYGIRNGSACSGGTICADPLLLNEPAQSATAQSTLDVFTQTSGTSSFYPSLSSPAINAGTSGGPSTDYFGLNQTSPATIGAVVQ
jgi:hypothetical protein